jgi:hypothetical protein
MKVKCTALVVALLIQSSPHVWAQNSPASQAGTSGAQGADVLWYGKAPPGWGGMVGSMKLIATNIGWAERGGRLYWTIDSGASWKDITPPISRNERLGGVFFLDPNTGWATINYKQSSSRELQFDFASTSDAGATWSRTTVPLRPEDFGIPTPRTPGWTMPPTFHLRGGGGTPAFADHVHGWMNVWFHGETMNSWDSAVLVTSDGGQTWKQAPNAPELNHLKMLLLTPLEGWLYGIDSGSNNGLYISRDGGRSWETVSLNPPDGVAPARCGVHGLPTFDDPKHGFLQINCSSGVSPHLKLSLVLFETNDSGRTWKADRMVKNLDDSSRQLYDVSALTDSLWIFASKSDHHPTLTKLGANAKLDGSEIAASERAGHGSLRNLSFTDPNHGWIIDGDGNLLSTADGGTTWATITPGPQPHVIHPLETLPSSPSSPTSTVPTPTSTPFIGASDIAPFDESRTSSLNQMITTTGSKHLGFDVAHTGSLGEMQAWWNYSPYHDVGVYINGAKGHTFKDPNLFNNGWVSSVTSYGWGLMPIWYGPQNPCAINAFDRKISFPYDPDQALVQLQGKLQAGRATGNAITAGFLPGSVIYYDMENYGLSCHPTINGRANYKVTVNGRTAAISFLQGWVSTLHQKGYLAGVYVSASNANDLAAINPDEVWIAAGGPPAKATIWGFGQYGLNDSQFSAHQRVHQFDDNCPACSGISGVEWGGEPIDDYFSRGQKIDLDIEDALVVGGGGTKTLPSYTGYTVSAVVDCTQQNCAGLPQCQVEATGINNPILDTHQAVGNIVGYWLKGGFCPSSLPGYPDVYGFVSDSSTSNNLPTLLPSTFFTWPLMADPSPPSGDYSQMIQDAITIPLGINNLSNVVGYDDNTFDWEANSVNDPPPLEVNDNYEYSCEMSADQWQSGGTSLLCDLSFNSLNVANGTGQSYTGINDVGWISGQNDAGFDSDSGMELLSFLLIGEGGQPAGFSPATSSVGNINGFGQVVYTDDQDNSWIYDYNGGNASQNISVAAPIVAINNNNEAVTSDGIIIEDADTSSGSQNAGGGTAPCPQLTSAAGINDWGQIVGFAATSSAGLAGICIPDTGND